MGKHKARGRPEMKFTKPTPEQLTRIEELSMGFPKSFRRLIEYCREIRGEEEMYEGEEGEDEGQDT